MENQLRKWIRLELGYGLTTKMYGSEKGLVRDLGNYEIQISGYYRTGIGLFVWKKDCEDPHVVDGKAVTVRNIKQVYDELVQKYIDK